MKKMTDNELWGILKSKFDFVLESYVLTENKLCVKPVYKFINAFAEDFDIPEFILIYSEADDPEEIYISVNAVSSHSFELLCGEICKYLKKDESSVYLTVYENEHTESFLKELNKKAEYDGTYSCGSFYFNGDKKTYIDSELDFKLLTPYDKNLRNSFTRDDDNYFKIIFHDFTENKIYRDCGIIGAYCGNDFVGYLAYYEIAENIRDVSYIYVGENYRGRNYGKDLLNWCKNKNIEESKISYYSHAVDNISESLAKSCGFLPCAKRYEFTNDIRLPNTEL